MMLEDDDIVTANLARLCEEAPPTKCGACGVAMEAQSVVVRVTVRFAWYNPRKGAADDFVPAFPSFTDPTRYSGSVCYHCPRCGVTVLHKQAVSRYDGEFHFQPPNEVVTRSVGGIVASGGIVVLGEPGRESVTPIAPPKE